ncbi:MAG: hypothetical protein WDW36_005882 [Sanguina aurantia]
MSETTRAADDLRVVRKLLWEVLSAKLHPAERQEVKRAIGAALIEENTGLFAEADAYSEILGDVQLGTEALLVRRQRCSTPQRTLVEAEVQRLLGRLHSQSTITPYGSAAIRERDPASVIPQSSVKERDVLTYINSSALPLQQTPASDGRPRTPHSTRPSTASSSRPATASSCLSATLRPATSSRRSTPTSAAGSSSGNYTEAGAVLSELGHEKLNVAAIDAVSAALRLALVEEREALTEDVEYLQALLQDEADRQHTVQHTVPPSIQDLTDYTARLSEAVGQEEARVAHEWRVAHMFEAADGELSAAGRLRSMVGVSRNGVPSSKPLWAGAFDDDTTTPGLCAHGALPEVHSSIPEEPSPDGPKLSHTLPDNPSFPPPPTSQAPLHPHPPHGAPLSRRPGIDSPLKGNGSSRTLMHTLSPNGHSQHGPVHLAHPSHPPRLPQNLPPQHPPPQQPSPQQPPHQFTSHSSITNSQPPRAELRQTQRPSDREHMAGCTSAEAMPPVIGPGPLGVLRHLSASRNGLSGFRPHSPASPSKPAFEQPPLQQSRGLGSSLGGMGSSLGGMGSGSISRASVLPHLASAAVHGLFSHGPSCVTARPGSQCQPRHQQPYFIPSRVSSRGAACGSKRSMKRKWHRRASSSTHTMKRENRRKCPSLKLDAEYMSQFDTSSPKPSTPTGPGSAMAVAALLDSYGSNLDDHPLLSEDDFNDYPDTDSPNTHAQSAAQLQDKIEDQTTTISHLRSKNHQLRS